MIRGEVCVRKVYTGRHGQPALDRHPRQRSASQVVVGFEHSLGVEGLLDLLTDERLDLDREDRRRPILLVVSDNGPQRMTPGRSSPSWPSPSTTAVRTPPADQALDRELLGPHQGRVAPTWRTSPIPSCWRPSSPGCALSRTVFACTT